MKIWLLSFLLVYLATNVIQMISVPDHLYKIVSVEKWNQSTSQSHVELSPMDDNFIHLSTEQQLDRIIQKFWANVSSYVLLTLDPKKLPGKLVCESNPGGSNKYYHLYEGLIPKESIVEMQIVNR